MSPRQALSSKNISGSVTDVVGAVVNNNNGAVACVECAVVSNVSGVVVKVEIQTKSIPLWF